MGYNLEQRRAAADVSEAKHARQIARTHASVKCVSVPTLQALHTRAPNSSKYSALSLLLKLESNLRIRHASHFQTLHMDSPPFATGT